MFRYLHHLAHIRVIRFKLANIVKFVWQFALVLQPNGKNIVIVFDILGFFFTNKTFYNAES